MRYMVVPGRLGLVDVIDRATGLPVEAGVTAVLLEPREARELVRWLLRRAHAETRRVDAEGGGQRSACAAEDVPLCRLARGRNEAEIVAQY
ncbi:MULTISPECIES: hypothetical protein [unclassified Rhizobium]|uniref:hypothetical protein n=1 Tax=unclassified Rhizobium TaxID=2613769 RepID=UPI0013AEFA1E|nr:hypothetical protein [Rhizobium sp. UBA1881]